MLVENAGQVVARLGLLGIEGQRGLELNARQRHVAPAIGQTAQVGVRRRQARIVFQRLAIALLGRGRLMGFLGQAVRKPLVGAHRRGGLGGVRRGRWS